MLNVQGKKLRSAMVASSSPGGPRWIVAQEGSRESYTVPLGFHRLHLLDLFYADIWCCHGRGLLRCGPRSARSLATRFHAEIPPNLVVSFSPTAIFARGLAQLRRKGLSAAGLAAVHIEFGQWFAGRVRKHLESLTLNPEENAFFGFNTNCRETLELLKERGIFTIVNQVDPGKVEEDLVLEEVERWPGWARAAGRIPESYWERLRAEWELADLVLVNSDWSAQALVRQGVACEKIIVVPLAIDLETNHAVEPINPTGALKVLWLGSVILRKGIQYLVEAARQLQSRNIEFLLAGPVGIAAEVVRSFPPNIKMLGRITRDQLSGVYKQAHLFVLPTISDGFAITQLEAMRHGLPVITTRNCGQVVTDGWDGLIVPARDAQALAEAIVRLDAERGWLREMSCNALKTVGGYDLPSNARMIHNLAQNHLLAQRTKPVLSYG